MSRKCSKCGAAFEDNALFCTECGQRFEASGPKGEKKGFGGDVKIGGETGSNPTPPFRPPAVEPSSKQGKSSNNNTVAKGPIIAVVVVVVIILAVVLGMMLGSAGNSSTSNISVAYNTNKTNTTNNTNKTNTTNNTNNTNTTNKKLNGFGILVNSDNSVNICVETASGGSLSGLVHRDKSDSVLADSNYRVYSVSEISAKHLSAAELCIAWNEPFAREGYHFKNSVLQAYFESCYWYEDRGWTGSLSGIAATNNSNLRECAGNSDWKNLATH